MSNPYNQTVEIPRRTMILFFVIDTSGSMEGAKIAKINTAIQESELVLKELSEQNADAQIKIATLTFSTGAEWVTSEPVPAESFKWRRLEAGGITDLGEAFRKLNEKLSREQFMAEATGSFAPVIFLMTDGAPTDDYQAGLAKLKKNNWFKKAIKIAIAIDIDGSEADRDVLEEFTGTKEAIITTTTPEELEKWIKFVSVRSSEIGSKSATVAEQQSDNAKQEEFIRDIQEEQKEDPSWEDWE